MMIMPNIERLQPEHLYAAQRPLWIDNFLYVGWGMGDIPDLINGNNVAQLISSERRTVSPVPDQDAIDLGDASEEFAGKSQADEIAPDEFEIVEALTSELEQLKTDSERNEKVSKALSRLVSSTEKEIIKHNRRMTVVYRELARRVDVIAESRDDLFIIGTPRPIRRYSDTYVNTRKTTEEYGARFAGAHVVENPETLMTPVLIPTVEGSNGISGLLPDGYDNVSLFNTHTLDASYLKKYYTFQPVDLWTTAELNEAKEHGASFDNAYNWTPKPYRSGPYEPPVSSEELS